MSDYTFQKELARALLSAGIEDVDRELHPAVGALAAMAQVAAAKPAIPFPAGFAPTLAPILPTPDPSTALPKADVVVVTWTVDEQDALAAVLTPGVSRAHWYRYTRNFPAYDPLIRAGAPAKVAHRLGSYFVVKVKSKTVICFKSELHLNQDGFGRRRPPAPLPCR